MVHVLCTRTSRVEWVVVVHESAPAWPVLALDLIIDAAQLGVGRLLQRHDERVLLLVAGRCRARVDQAPDLFTEVFYRPGRRPARNEDKTAAVSCTPGTSIDSLRGLYRARRHQ